MREHIELRVLRSISRQTRLAHLPVDDQYFNHLVKVDEVLRASTDFEDFSKLYLLSSFLKKWKGFKSGLDPEAAAFEAWRAAERQCFSTNFKLNTLDNAITDSPIDRVIRRVRYHIIQMIGNDPGDSWRRFCDWPTGATADTAMVSLVHEKVHEKASSSGLAVKHLYGVYELGFSILRWNRLQFVPKTYKVHRPIACEPTVNAFLQKGVGRLIRRRLQDRGIDLDTQADVNRENCLLAQSCGLSTIDLESASDTLCLSLVRLVMPEPWWKLLNELRSEFTFYKKENRYIKLEKFSSMGNGFTFELETVIFRAICLAAYDILEIDPSTLCVFGDDIVCDRRCFDLTVQFLTFFGFIVNHAKTFKEGRFFESCGRHYFDERNCTPVYCKDIVKSVPDLIILYNKLFRWAQRTGLKYVVADALRIVYSEIKTRVRGNVPYQPSFLDGDMGLCTDEQRGWNFDAHGDVILHHALVIVPIQASIVEQPFYYRNWLRCGNSFYSVDNGRLERSFGERWRIQRRLKRWRSSMLS